PDCNNLSPPRKHGESWNSPTHNCTIDTCVNGTVTQSPKQCSHETPPKCENNFPAVKVLDETGCCYKYECQCRCFGFGDPHYVTFDGTYYSFQGNCSYILVKEIIPKYNFSVVIDNVYCDAPDGLSCPQSLTVYYNSYVIFMTQKLSDGIVTNLVYVNHKRIFPAYQNKDFRITDNGIETLLVIPAIDAQVMFTGLMFNIELPWSKFHGNTEGQCGTCDNNRKDDCRLPNGTIDSSCSDMANHWPAHDNSSHCTPPPTPPNPPPGCNPDICKIIKSKTFEECHKVVPYEPYVEACKYDVCLMNTTTIGCTSLKTYADECAMQGVCIEWRSASHGACEFRCKEPKEYKSCGPQIESTCDERYNLKFIKDVSLFSPMENMIWEGCYCPPGTTLLSHSSDANATWSSDCDICTCDPDTLTIICDHLTCPTQSPVKCDQDGQVKVTETVDCCERTKCMPKPICLFNNTEYLPGQSVPMKTCEKCVCSDKLDPQNKLHAIECEPVHCDTNCPVGFAPQPVDGQCCGNCVQTSCVAVYSGSITHSIPVSMLFLCYFYIFIETFFITLI
uniref:Mucin 5f n=1 Tax=Denticeps clupeoides TaxID=299321 RepID=A0AAY4ES69_9TELE